MSEVFTEFFWGDPLFSGKCFSKLFICRLLLSIIILWVLKIPFRWKLVCLIFLDLLDCWPSEYFCSEISWCGSPIYQQNDKKTDTLIYFLILFYLYMGSPNSTDISENNFIRSIPFIFAMTILFIFRYIGVKQFLNTGNRSSLILYPNIFLENITLLLFLYSFGISTQIIIFVFFLSLVIKIIQESALHSDF